MSLPKTQATATAASNYAAVKAQIERARLLPWSSAPGMQIGTFNVNPLTLRSMTDLQLAGNAFLTEGTAIEGDVAAYIWRHMPDYSPGDSQACDKAIQAISKQYDLHKLVLDIFNHLGAAFEETPEGDSFDRVRSSNRLPPIPAIASICHEYAAAYAVDPRTVADIDLRLVFQCCRAIRMAAADIKYNEPKKLREAKSALLKAHG